MSTFIINLNDTVAMSDSGVVELAKVINTCQPCVQEVATNTNDVKNTFIVCATIIVITAIVALAITLWHRKEVAERYHKYEKDWSNNIDLKDKEFELWKQEEQEKLTNYKKKLQIDKENEDNKDKSKKNADIIERIVTLSKNKDGSVNLDTVEKSFAHYDNMK